jgi:hypothetical protein
MRRILTMTAVAAGFAAMLGVQAAAQTQETKTKVKAEDAKTVNFTGCLQTGTETKTYMLQQAVPVRTTETVGTSGEVSTSTEYELLPSETVQMQEHVGHKVEVTGVLVPAGKGDAKIKTETKAPEGKEKTEAKIEKGAAPQLRVISIKHLADKCSE